MPQKKKQHYVPQFYFRLFSEDGHTINMFNLKRMQMLFNRAFKNFCKEDYFYSRNTELESEFSSLESKCSDCIRKIIQEKQIGKLSQKEYFFLLLFVLFQQSRTKLFKSEVKEQTQAFVENIMKPFALHHPEAKKLGITEKIFEENKITLPSDHLYSILQHLLAVPLINDLIPVIVENITSKNFIFSDAPVIFYNKFFKDKRNNALLGFQSAGLQIFIPLNNKILLLFYDSEFYDFSGSSNTFVITNENDIDSLNSLQIVNCDENIYFSYKKDVKYIENLHLDITKGGTHKPAVRIYKNIMRHDRRLSDIIEFTYDHMRFNLNLSFLTPKNIESDKMYRNAELIAHHIKFTDDYMKNLEKQPKKTNN